MIEILEIEKEGLTSIITFAASIKVGRFFRHSYIFDNGRIDKNSEIAGINSVVDTSGVLINFYLRFDVSLYFFIGNHFGTDNYVSGQYTGVVPCEILGHDSVLLFDVHHVTSVSVLVFFSDDITENRIKQNAVTKLIEQYLRSYRNDNVHRRNKI